jgi:hypothetical protein
MLLLQKSSIANVLFCFLAATSLSGCFITNSNDSPTFVTTQQPKPITPNTDILDLKSIDWIIITPENAKSIFEGQQENVALFALTQQGFENLILNLNDIMSLVRQQKVIIQTLEE